MILRNARYLGPDFNLHAADLRLEGSRIVAIQKQLQPGEGEQIIDCSNHILYPALADCHVHTPDTLFRGLFCDLSLHDWCGESEQGRLQQKLFEYVDASVPTEAFRTLVLYAYLQYLKSGVAFIVETGQADDSCAVLESCANEIGIKALVDWYDKMPATPPEGNTISRGIHLPEEEDIKQSSLQHTIDLAKENPRYLMTHCLETKFRRAEILRKFGCSTVDLLEKYHLLDERTILFHCIETSGEDVSKLAKSKATLVHCPISNQISGAAPMELEALLQQGARITVGTDYLSHDIWDTLRTTYAELKQTKDPGKHSARTVWEMATTNASSIASSVHYSGAIEVGSSADLLFIKDCMELTPLIHLPTFSNVAFNTLMFTRPSMIEHMMVSGRWVIRDGICTTLNEIQLKEAYKTILKDVFHPFLV